MNSKISPPKRIRNHVNPLADRIDINFAGFSNTKPIMVDIGAYRGEFSQQLVEQFSDTHNFIVTEIRKPFVNYLRTLFHNHKNVAVFDGDSARNIRGLLKSSIKNGALIDYIFINFPAPWFKERHKKRRVVNHNFLNDLKQLLNTQDTKSQTKIIFQTDQKQMFDETIELVKENGAWDIQYYDQPLWGIQSHWEVMKAREGSHIHRMQITLQRPK